ncbi:hypothetical protein G195_000750 [Phytophthora kernoviae 00238/432]|uniref:Alcohol dehydrogenase-like C-terminal domain-containing protein n=1 Tax=Phytophthora kernoviae 00238/432 TaxID=1284355 RepID=A0A8J4SPX1_9STRA|nr:hypothetical protein G195_000750 [Phytophthora kernoviae 00238/432]
MGFLGLAGGGGGFSEYVTAEENMVHAIPDSISYEQGALVEPSAVALHAVRQSKLKVGDTAAVFGAGPIGLLVIEALKASGASDIYVVELSEERKAKAEELGAIVIDPAQFNVVEEIHARTQGGVNVAYEVTGVPREAPILPNSIVMKERTVNGIIGYRDVFPAVISLMAKGFFPADKLVTKRINLDEVVEHGFEALLKEKNQVKILVKAE